MKKVLGVLLVVVMVAALAACAPGPNGFENTKIEKGYVPGFWYGLWNGIIAPVTFVISLFTNTVKMYEVHNNGGWYNLGFLLGISSVFGGGAGSAARRRR